MVFEAELSGVGWNGVGQIDEGDVTDMRCVRTTRNSFSTITSSQLFESAPSNTVIAPRPKQAG